MAFPNYTYPAYGAYNPVTPFAPAPQVYQPQQPTQQPSQTIQPQSNVNTQPAFFCRPVASREEALGVPVDFMGAPMFFPDLAHNVVYMKRFNTNTGAADVFEFHGQQQAKEQQAENPAPAFAPLDEFMDMKDTINNLKDEIERLKKPTSGGKAGKKNDASGRTPRGVRGLKRQRPGWLCAPPRSHPSRGAGIEIVRNTTSPSIPGISRTPHGVRGLKSAAGPRPHGVCLSPPSRGAWINPSYRGA